MDTMELRKTLFGTRPVVSIALSQTEGALKHVVDSLVPARKSMEDLACRARGISGGLHAVLLVQYRYVFSQDIHCRDVRAHLQSDPTKEIEHEYLTYYLNEAGTRTLYRAVRNLYAPRSRMEGFTPHGDVLYYAMAAGESLATIDICKQPIPGIIVAA